MVKHILFFCVFVWTCVFAFGEENKLYGPDGKLCVIVSDEGGVPSYSVLYEGVTFLQKSPLGIETNLGDFTLQMALTHVGQLSSVNEEYQLLTIKNSNPRYQANVQTYTFSKGGRKIYDIVFQVSNHDIAFKYRVYSQDNIFIIRKSKFPQNPKRSVRFSGKRTKRSVQKRKARNTQKAETKVL